MEEQDTIITDVEKELEAEFQKLNQPESTEETTEETPADTTNTEETSADEPADKVPETEEKQEEKPADVDPQPETPKDDPVEKEPELILGKFKSQADLEKAYQNLEKAYSQKSEKVKDAEVFKTPDDFENAVLADIEKTALGLVERAVNKISDPEHLKEATMAVAMYKRTGDMQHIEKARGFLSNIEDRRLEVDLRNCAASIKQEYNARRDEIELAPVTAALHELEAEDPEWLKDQAHQDILVAAIKLNRKVDVKSVKELIDKVSENAVKKYIASESKKAAMAAEKKPAVSLKESTRPTPPEPEKDFRLMTIEEQLEQEYAKR